MTRDEIIEARDAKPFKPVTIYVADGRTFDVTHPESMVIAPNGRTLRLLQPNATLQILDMLLVTGLERHGGDAGASGRED